MSSPYEPPRSVVADPHDASLSGWSWSWFYLSIRGRIARRPYWLYLLTPLVVSGMAFGVAAGYFMHGDIIHPDTARNLWILLVIVIWWPSIAVQVKRWHDLDRSGWWVLLSFVPYVGVLITI